MDSSRMEPDARGICTPAEAAELLREGEAAWGAVKGVLPEEWVTELRKRRRTARAFRPLLDLHEEESPQVHCSRACLPPRLSRLPDCMLATCPPASPPAYSCPPRPWRLVIATALSSHAMFGWSCY